MSAFTPKPIPKDKKTYIFPLALSNEQNQALDAAVLKLKAKDQQISKQALVRQMIDHCLSDMGLVTPKEF